jgi:hypothetical protein
MERARRAAVTALLLALLASGLDPGPPSVETSIDPVGAVTWPASTLVVSEIVTGGASASDEFIEIANQGVLPVDLQGLEVAYATASGATVTRKGTWTAPFVLEPGRRLLLANTLGAFASLADATYSGGLAAPGGAVVLRSVGGTPIDAVGWGDAVSQFVEGAPVVAPPASSSIERRPGGSAGNGADTNDNASDWLVSAVPSPQNVAAPPVPAPSASPSPEPSSTASPTPDPSTSLSPTPSPTPQPTPTPTIDPTAEPTPPPTLEPTQSPTSQPTATPVPDPTISIAEARAMPDGSSATVTGVLTTPLAVLEGARSAFLQDATGGIALYLDAAATGRIEAGTAIRVSGTLDERFAQRTLRIAEADLVIVGRGGLPEPTTVTTGGTGEAHEGRLVALGGETVGAPTVLSDGTGLFVDDGTGQVRVIVTPEALGLREVPGGTRVEVIGPLGQRDSTGTGTEGYRVLVTLQSGITIPVVPSPSPTSSPSPSASAEPSSNATPTPTATPTATTPIPDVLTIATARTRAVGTTVTVEGVVTAEAGRLGLPTLLSVQDATGGVAVRLADGLAGPARGVRVRVSGALADPYGQTEIRLTGALTTLGSGSLPAPLRTDLLTERIEGRLVTIQATLARAPRRSASGDLSLDLESGDHALRVIADTSAGLVPSSFERGATYRITGVVGQRASSRGALDGYRVWVRDRHDVELIARPAPTPTPGPGHDGGTRPLPLISIARALRQAEGDAAIEGVVTAGASLLDATGRRIVVQDASAAIEILIPVGTRAPSVGTRLRVAGELGHAYGAPRLRATEVRRLGAGGLPTPREYRGAGAAQLEWRLVRVTGEIADLTKLGSRWRAEIALGNTHVVVNGLAGAEIPATALVEGRRATIVGILRRAYPTATDQRYSVNPRGRIDIRLAKGPPVGSPSPASSPSGSPAPQPTLEDVDLRDLAAHAGTTVRVGGLIVDLETDGFTIDDGTARGRVVLLQAAADFLPLLDPGDAVNVTGSVEAGASGLAVVVRDPGGLVRAGDPRGDRSGRPEDASGAGPAGDPAARMHAASVIEPFGLGVPGLATLASLGLITLASLAVTVLRRASLQRRMAARIAERVAAVAGRPDPGDDGAPAPR